MNIRGVNFSDNGSAESATAEGRQGRILTLVRQRGFQTIEALALQFGVTSQTIRRDVNQLCERGLCRRRHGGIDTPAENVSYPQRQILHREPKRRIAQCVAQAVPESASLFFGIGTTPEQCAHALAERTGLRVMTNNLNVALALSRNRSCEITIAGGRLRNSDHDVIAGEAHGFFERFAVDIGIYGVGGIAEDGSLLDFNHDEVHMRSELARHCRQRFLVFDHSKFGRGATVKGGHISEASVVFTDKPVPESIARMLAQAQVRLVVADGDPNESPPAPHN